MIPAPFDYEVATSVEEAVGLLSGGADDGDVKLLAGGQSLLPLMKLRFARPTMVVDIARVQGLSAIEDDGDAIAVGALARHHDVARSDLLATHCRVVAEAAR
ncbi:MAG: FAD binding domain-containing protein, partial [Gaiellales bacterium]